MVQVSDGFGGTDTITVNVTVSPRNDPPNNTAVPTVSGTGHVGKVLTATTGTWNDTTDQVPGTLSYTYQWQRADDASDTNLACYKTTPANYHVMCDLHEIINFCSCPDNSVSKLRPINTAVGSYIDKILNYY